MVTRCVQPFFWPAAGALVLLGVSVGALAAGGPVAPMRISDAPLIDGRLVEPCWREATEYASFFRLREEGLAEPRTELRIVYDEKRIYLGVTCHEPSMDEIVAKVRTDDNGRAWADDAIEICLDPSGRGDDYFHFIVNTRGARYDSMVTHGGGIPTWDADWHAAVQKRANAWTAEISIPFYSLEIIPEVRPDTWRFNIVRTRRAGGKMELTTWARLEQSYHEAHRFVALGPLNVDFARFCYSVGKPAKQSVIRGDVLDTSFEIDVRNLTGRDRAVEVEGWLVDAAEKALIKSMSVTLKHGESQRVQLAGFAVRKPGPYSLHVLVNDDATRHLSTHHFDIRFVPVKIVLDEPLYRSTIYATQQLDHVELRVKIGLSEEDRKGAGLRLAIVDPHGRDLVTTDLSGPLTETVPVQLPCAKLGPGDYTIVARLLGRRGEVVSQDRHELHKLPPPSRGSEVRVDRDLNLVVDGKAVFPFGWYGHVPAKVAAREGYTVLYRGSTLYIPAAEFCQELDEYHCNSDVSPCRRGFRRKKARKNCSRRCLPFSAAERGVRVPTAVPLTSELQRVPPTRHHGDDLPRASRSPLAEGIGVHAGRTRGDRRASHRGEGSPGAPRLVHGR